MPRTAIGRRLALAALAFGCGGTPPAAEVPGESPGDPSVPAAHELPAPSPETLAVCWSDADCMVVPFDHCCGSTKRAINRGYLEAYRAHPEWQSFHDPEECAVMGMCGPDDDVTEARCLLPDGAAGGPGGCDLAW